MATCSDIMDIRVGKLSCPDFRDKRGIQTSILKNAFMETGKTHALISILMREA